MKAFAGLVLLWILVSDAGAGEITAEQAAELQKLRDSLWDQGFTEEEIRKELETQHARMRAAAPAPSPKEPATSSKPETGSALERILEAFRFLGETGIQPEEEMVLRAEEFRSRWGKSPDFIRLKMERDARKGLLWRAKEWWRDNLVRSGKSEKEAVAWINAREPSLVKSTLGAFALGLNRDELVRALKEKNPEVPSEMIHLLTIFGPDPEPQAATPAPEPAAPALSDEEIDQIVDEMMKELEQAPPRN